MNAEFYFIKVAAESEAVSLPKPISETHKERPGLEKDDMIKHEVFASTDIRLKPKKTLKNLKKEVSSVEKSPVSQPVIRSAAITDQNSVPQKLVLKPLKKAVSSIQCSSQTCSTSR